MQNGSSVGIHTHGIEYTFFFTFGADLYVQSVLSNKISASQLSRKSIKSEWLVGAELYRPRYPVKRKSKLEGGLPLSFLLENDS